jgi:hypothetical protein
MQPHTHTTMMATRERASSLATDHRAVPRDTHAMRFFPAA